MSEGALTIQEPTSSTEVISGALLLDREASNLLAEFPSPFGVKAQTSVVGSFEREEAYRQCIAQIRDYSSLPTNWDTYGGFPAAAATIEFSLDLLTRLQVMPDISAPHVSPISGGVYLEWRFGESILYFEIEESSILHMERSLTGTIEVGEDSLLDVERAIRRVEYFHRSAV